MWIILAAVPALLFSAGAQATQPDWSISIASVSQSGDAANDNSYTPSLSADGRYLAFDSVASNLVQGDANGSIDVFVRDMQTGQIERVTLTTGSRLPMYSSAP